MKKDIEKDIKEIWNNHRLFHYERIRNTVTYIEHLIEENDKEWKQLLKNLRRKKDEEK